MGIRIDQKEYSPNVSVYIEDAENDETVLREIAGMLRGLMCAIEGYKPLTGKTNEHFRENYPVKLSFTTPENACYFKERVKLYFSEEVLRNYLIVKRRVYK